MTMRPWQRLGRSHALAFTAAALSIFAAASALAESPFDGTYSGSTMLTGAASPVCAKNGTPVQMTVIDGKVSYNHFGTILTGTVAPDGSFTASGMNMRYKPPASQSMSGHISGTSAEAETGTSICPYHLTFRKL
jgi:hypothetical protein